MASDCLCSSMFATLCRFCCKSQIFKKLCENPFFLLKRIFRLLLSLKIELLDFSLKISSIPLKKHTIVNVLFFQVARDNLSLEKIHVRIVGLHSYRAMVVVPIGLWVWFLYC